MQDRTKFDRTVGIASKPRRLRAALPLLLAVASLSVVPRLAGAAEPVATPFPAAFDLLRAVGATASTPDGVRPVEASPQPLSASMILEPSAPETT